MCPKHELICTFFCSHKPMNCCWYCRTGTYLFDLGCNKTHKWVWLNWSLFAICNHAMGLHSHFYFLLWPTISFFMFLSLRPSKLQMFEYTWHPNHYSDLWNEKCWKVLKDFPQNMMSYHFSTTTLNRVNHPHGNWEIFIRLTDIGWIIGPVKKPGR